MTPLAQKAFVAPKTSTPSSASRRVVVAALSQNSTTSAAKVQRRSMAALLAALPAILPVGQALALIPDDDDEELIEKARANRKAKLAEERATEKTFARTEGLNTGYVFIHFFEIDGIGSEDKAPQWTAGFCRVFPPSIKESAASIAPFL